MKSASRIDRRLRMRDLHLLKVVAERGSMARASKELGLSQPAISKVIGDLEKDLCTGLFTRNSRGIELTECGHVLLRRGRVILDELRQGLQEIENLSDPTAGEVRIGVVEAWTPFISSIVDRTARRYPNVLFTVAVNDVDTLVRALRDRTLDLVISREALARVETDLAAEYLFQDRLVVVCAQSHRLASRRKLALADLIGERWALGPADTYLGQLLTKAFRSQGLSLPQAAMTSPSVQMRLDMLPGGQYLTVYSSAMLSHLGDRARFKVLPIDLGDIAGPMAALTLKVRPPQGAVKLVLIETRAIAKTISS